MRKRPKNSAIVDFLRGALFPGPLESRGKASHRSYDESTDVQEWIGNEELYGSGGRIVAFYVAGFADCRDAFRAMARDRIRIAAPWSRPDQSDAAVRGQIEAWQLLCGEATRERGRLFDDLLRQLGDGPAPEYETAWNWIERSALEATERSGVFPMDETAIRYSSEPGERGFPVVVDDGPHPDPQVHAAKWLSLARDIILAHWKPDLFRDDAAREFAGSASTAPAQRRARKRGRKPIADAMQIDAAFREGREAFRAKYPQRGARRATEQGYRVAEVELRRQNGAPAELTPEQIAAIAVTPDLERRINHHRQRASRARKNASRATGHPWLSRLVRIRAELFSRRRERGQTANPKRR